MTTETVFGQTLALRLGNGDEHHALESDKTELNVKGNLYLYLMYIFISMSMTDYLLLASWIAQLANNR